MDRYIEIESLTNDQLLIFCNEIFEYQNGDGDLNKETNFYKFLKNIKRNIYGILDILKP
jgi:hypothetical protein